MQTTGPEGTITTSDNIPVDLRDDTVRDFVFVWDGITHKMYIDGADVTGGTGGPNITSQNQPTGVLTACEPDYVWTCSTGFYNRVLTAQDAADLHAARIAT